MTVEHAADGWFIERNGRYYHINEQWLADMYQHQVKPYGNNAAFNRLVHGFRTGADADEIGRLFVDFYDNRTKPPRNGRRQASEFGQFMAEQKGKRANRR